jgi:hypothetical protein
LVFGDGSYGRMTFFIEPAQGNQAFFIEPAQGSTTA